MTNKSNLNSEISTLVSRLNLLGKVDFIAQYNSQILSASCYNSPQLLEVYSQYKFIICFENSYADGYITEKIFNCFLAGSIPIYSGSPQVSKFLSSKSFFSIPPGTAGSVDLLPLFRLLSNEAQYLEMLNAPKISEEYDDENYLERMVATIEKKLGYSST
jgi:hypothetical protein